VLDTRLSDEQVQLKETVEAFAREVVAPVSYQRGGERIPGLGPVEGDRPQAVAAVDAKMTHDRPARGSLRLSHVSSFPSGRSRKNVRLL
jgi:hypothetical protein